MLDWHCGCVLISVLLYLEHGEGEGVSQVVVGGQQHFAVVSIQIHTGQQVQLGVHPVETPVRQVWEDGGGRDGEQNQGGKGKGEKRRERETNGERERGHWERKGLGWEVYECNGPVATPSIFFDMTAEALRWENTDVIVILPVDFFAREKYMWPWANWLVLPDLLWRNTLLCYNCITMQQSPLLFTLLGTWAHVCAPAAGHRAMLWSTWKFTDSIKFDIKGRNKAWLCFYQLCTDKELQVKFLQYNFYNVRNYYRI